MNHAEFRLKLGNEYPYDCDDNGEIIPGDWAVKAARGVLSDMCDRRGVKWELQKVDTEIRIEMIQTLAEIIRLAALEAK